MGPGLLGLPDVANKCLLLVSFQQQLQAQELNWHSGELVGDAAVELVHQDPSASIARPSSSNEGQPRCNVTELLPLRLHYKVPWPLSMIVDDTMLVKYNQVLTFLLQVHKPAQCAVLCCSSDQRHRLSDAV